MKRHMKIAQLILAFTISFAPLYAEDGFYKKTDLFLFKKDKFEHELVLAQRNSLKDGIDTKFKDCPSDLKSLVYAVAFGDFETADSLKDRVDLNAVDSLNRNILLFQAVNPESKLFSEQIRWVVKNGIDIDVLVYSGRTQELQSDGSYKTIQNYKTYIEWVSGNPQNLEILLHLCPEFVHKRNPTTGQTILGKIAASPRSAPSIEILLASETQEINWNNIHNPVVQAVLAGEYGNALLLLSHGARHEIAFEYQGESYASILDFLKRHPRSIKEDTFYSESAGQRQEQTYSYTTKMKAKKAMLKLLERTAL